MKNILYILISMLFLTSCVMEDAKYEQVDKILVSKEKILKDGDTKFVMSFSDLSSVYADYGIYTNYEVGDTVCFSCLEGKSFSHWNCYIPNPNKK